MLGSKHRLFTTLLNGVSEGVNTAQGLQTLNAPRYDY